MGNGTLSEVIECSRLKPRNEERPGVVPLGVSTMPHSAREARGRELNPARRACCFADNPKPAAANDVGGVTYPPKP